MMKKSTFLKSLLVSALFVGGVSSVSAGDKTVVKYSFDDATSPSLTPGNRTAFNYTKTSVISGTPFLAIIGENNTTGATNISLGATDLSTETWTLEFEWAGYSGCNNRYGYTYLKAGDKNLFTITDVSNFQNTFNLTYGDGDDVKATLSVAPCDKNTRGKDTSIDALNTKSLWWHFTVKGSDAGVTLTIAPSAGGDAVVDKAVLSATNVNPTAIALSTGALGDVAIDELHLYYYVEGEVIQTPVAAYTAVNGIERTITATCDTEGATIQHSTDGSTYVDGASVTVDASGKVYFKAVKGSSESEVLEFDAVAGEEIVLKTPTINRSSNTEVTISADQTSLLLSPTATIYYEYGAESGSFTGSKTLTVAADATITAYAEATGYATSAVAERAVALFPTDVETIESTAAKTSGWSASSFSSETKDVSGRTYAALLLDDAQWGKNLYLQTDGKWGLRASGNWYINDDKTESWLLLPSMQAGDVIVVDIDNAASSVVNAEYSKYTYGSRHAYEVVADGDVELAFKKINSSTMDYFRGVYAYRHVASVPVSITTESGYASFCSTLPLDLAKLPAGLTAYQVSAVTATTVTLEPVTEAVKAGTGLILKGKGNFDIPVIASTNTLSTNKLVGVTEDKTITGDFVLKAGKFVKASDEGKLKAGKAYLPATAVPAAAAELTISFGAETTGISVAKAESVKDAEVYNLAGQRVSQPTKGLYIVGGKKVVMK